MKKLISLLLAALMLASCTRQDTAGTVETVNLDHITMEVPQGLVLTTLEKAADINDYYPPYPEFTYILQQQITFGDGVMYAFPQYPADVIHEGADAILEYAENYKKMDYLEVYSTDDFSSYQTLKLDLPEKTLSTRIVWDDTTGTIQIYDNRVLKYGSEEIDTWRLVFDTDGNLLSEEPVDLHYDVVFNETLYLIGGDLYYNHDVIGGRGSEERPSLRVLKAGENESEILQKRIRGMCCADGMVYYIKGDETENYSYSPDLTLYRYDPSTGETEILLEFSSMVYFEGNLHYDSKNGILYTAGNGILYGLDTESGEVIPVLSTYGETLHIEGGYDDKIVLSTSFSKLTSYTMPEKLVSIYNDMKTLSFCRLADPASTASTDTTASGSYPFRILQVNGYKYQSATAYACEDADEYAFTMAKKLLAGDTDFDLFYVTTEMFELFDPMYFEDLSRYSILNGIYDKYLPGVRELCSIGGKTALIPVNLMTQQLCIDPSVTAEPFEMPETFHEFMKLSEVGYNEGAVFMRASKLHFLLSPWFEQAAANMLAETVSDEECREAFELLYQLGEHFTNSDRVSLKYQSKIPVLAEAVSIAGVFSNYGTMENQRMTEIIPVKEGMKQVISGDFWAVNPNSPNKEAAAIWLTAQQYQQYEAAEEYDAGLFNVPVTESNVGSEAAYRVLCEQIAFGIRASTLPDFKMKLYYHFKDIEDGKLTPGQAADELFRYLKMIRDE